MLGDGDVVVRPGDDEGRGADLGEAGPGVGPVHDRGLLADERLWAGLVRHLADDPLQREIIVPGGAYPAPAENVGHLGELALSRHRDLVTPTLRLFGCVR